MNENNNLGPGHSGLVNTNGSSADLIHADDQDNLQRQEESIHSDDSSYEGGMPANDSWISSSNSSGSDDEDQTR